ncbi:alpha/beta hydrolase [Mycobacterium intracellulare]|uniref:putative alpha/beta hydrolase n=1 Tax=Mycobacterium intracellulare TaxID=1767 RepID=UPI001EED0BC8|nr:alpha/beta hydrolase [Mycobacterium intracellulare]MEE3751838.1 alpha/beta hydrolase [Mycobacterium intracellulare]
MELRYISTPFLVAESGGDPWSTNAGLQSGRPARISDLARAFRAAAASTGEAAAAFEAARRRFEAAWNHRNGEHPINDSAEVQRVSRSLGLQTEQLPKIAVDLEKIAATLAEAQRISARYITALEYDLQDIDDEICEALADGDHCDVDDLREDAVAETKAIVFALGQIRDRYAAVLQAALDGLRTDGADPAEISGIDELLIPPTPTSPEQVKRWWDSLSANQKRLLADQHPPELGNLNGIPADVRDSVNQAAMNDDLRRVEDAARRRGVVPDALRDNALNNRDADVFTNPAEYGLCATDITRYQNAAKTNDFLTRDKGSGLDRGLPPMLWAYDPLAFGGKGRAVIAIGNPDKSRNTAVMVPGTNSSVRGGWMSDGPDDAINLYQQSLKADPFHSTAVLAWMGYDAPEFDHPHWEQALADPAKLEQVGTPWRARQAAALLAADVNGLASTHDGLAPSRVTVLGHSYGSTTVADAFVHSGMRANDAVLTGCPGTDLAHRAADFHLDGGRLYVGAASTDAISWIGETGSGLPNGLNETLGGPLGPWAGLGADPAHEGFGAVRFRAEVAGSHSLTPWFTDHARYYDVGSEALHNVTEIVTGHGDRLAAEGMLAADRAQARIAIPRQLHTPLGTVSLPHVEIRMPISVDPEWDRPARTVTNGHGF